MRRNTINYFLCICFLLCLPNNDLFGMNRGISSVSYNLLNLPGVIDVKSPVAEARNEYYYSSDGVKRKVIKKWNPNYSTSPVIGSAVNVSSLTSTETTDYIGNLIYEGGTLKRIQTENGYIENGVYHYYIQDYLGNTRMVLDPSAEIVQWLNYYPFGMLWADKVDNNLQPYKYSGKELDSSHGLNLYDFHARFYDPALGRFMTMDPLAEKYYSWSPYVYCFNNPVKYVDPTGMDVYRYDDKTGEFTLHQETKDSFDQVGKFKYDKKTDTYTLKTDKKGNAETRMDNIEKGILSDGINFKENNNMISVGGEGQATEKGVEDFALGLSEMVRKEIGGAYFSKDGATSTTHMSIGAYKNNTYTKTKGNGHSLWNRLYPDSKLENNITGFFHTHPGLSNRTNASAQDLESKADALSHSPTLHFFILTRPVYYGGAQKFPY